MTDIEIALEQAELFARGAGCAGFAFHHGVSRQNLAPATRHLEGCNIDTNRPARPAGLAGRAVGDCLRAAEPGTRQAIIESDRAINSEIGEHFSFHAARQVGAGLWRRQIEFHLADEIRRDDFLGVGLFHRDSTASGSEGAPPQEITMHRFGSLVDASPSEAMPEVTDRCLQASPGLHAAERC